MSEWTPERLDALPTLTSVGYERSGLFCVATRRAIEATDWIDDTGEWLDGEELLAAADPGSIRVASVPVDALLSSEVAEVVAENLGHKYRTASHVALRAVIAHVTGGQP